jgi:hypothetical protein
MQKFAAPVIALWNRGCVGKLIVAFGALMLIGICSAPFRTAQRPTPNVAPVLAATSAATQTPSPSPTTPPTSVPRPSATSRVPLTGTDALNRTATAEAERQQRAPTATPVPTRAPVPTVTPLPAPEPTAAQPASFDSNGDGKVTCADFSTQAEAKVALAAGYKKLDNDGDGIPCESLP